MNLLSPRQVRTPEATPPVLPVRPSIDKKAEGLPGAAAGLLHPTHYARLGVPDDADALTLSEAFRRAEQAAADPTPPVAPDPTLAGPDADAARRRQLQLAYAVLSDPQRRGVYDQWLAREQARQAGTRPPRWRRAGWLLAAVLLAVLLWGLLD